MNLRFYLIVIKLQMFRYVLDRNGIVDASNTSDNQLSPLLLLIFLLCFYASVTNLRIASYVIFQNISHFVQIDRTTSL